MAILNPLNLIPPQYKILAYILIAVAIFGGGVYSGYKATSNHFTPIIAKMEKEKAEYELARLDLQSRLEKEMLNIKERIIVKYVDKVRIIKEKEYVYRDQAINVVPDRVELSAGWVYLHDTAARGDIADPTRSADATGSGVEANQALAVVAETTEPVKPTQNS
jgi:hypothetical protein